MAFYDPRTDPQASEQTLRDLAKKDPAAVVMHPNCPQELWEFLAMRLPLDALKSPLYLLFLLEDPSIWEKIEKEGAAEWVPSVVSSLSSPKDQDFVADCFQYAIDSLGQNPNEIVRDLLVARRAYGRREIDATAWTQATNHGQRAFRLMSCIAEKYDAKDAIDTLLKVIGLRLPNKERQETEQRASVWMWRRLLDYLYNRIPSR